MLIALVTWLTTGSKQFRGPESGGVVMAGGEAAAVVNEDIGYAPQAAPSSSSGSEEVVQTKSQRHDQ